MKKLIWLTWHETNYNSFLFSSLSKVKDIDLTVYYVKKRLETHPWKRQPLYGSIRLETLKTIYGVDWRFIWKCIFARETYFIISGWNNLTMFLAITILAFFKKKFAIWSDTPRIHLKRNIIKGTLRKLWIEFIFTKVDKIMATGKPGINNFIKMGIKREKVINFPFVTDLKHFDIRFDEKKDKEKSIVFLSSGRLVNSHKGHDLAIMAVKKITNHNIKLKIAGIGPDFIKLKELVKKLELQDRVEFLGWIEIDDLPAFYNSGHAYLHTSHFDPFPNSVLEAMACGLPVIGSDMAGSILDRVEEGYNGFIHKSGSLISIIEKINVFIDNIWRIEDLRKNARKTALCHRVDYNIDVIKNILDNA
ncbi:MAG: glycosyltransferase [Deltaproteobacteria bacterium]|nr:glycosyltransferase [Deltaproteobacteria bacterium]